jgi:hypothetical protein
MNLRLVALLAVLTVAVFWASTWAVRLYRVLMGRRVEPTTALNDLFQQYGPVLYHSDEFLRRVLAADQRLSPVGANLLWLCARSGALGPLLSHASSVTPGAASIDETAVRSARMLAREYRIAPRAAEWAIASWAGAAGLGPCNWRRGRRAVVARDGPTLARRRLGLTVVAVVAAVATAGVIPAAWARRPGSETALKQAAGARGLVSVDARYYIVDAAAVDGARSLAVGSVERKGAYEVAVWLVDQSGGFVRQSLPMPSGSGSGSADGVAVSGTTAIVVGSTGLAPEARASIWHLGLGKEWRIVDGSGLTTSSQARFTQVVAGRSGYALLGWDYRDEEFTWRIWSSASGEAWTSMSVPSGSASMREPHLAAWQGGLVLSGCDPCGDARKTVVWSSVDGGAAWTSVVAPGGDGAIYLNDLVTVGGRLMAVGTVDGAARIATTWTSTDAVHWEPTPLPVSSAQSSGYRGFTNGSAAVVVGNGDGTGRAWRSTLQKWQQLALPPDGPSGEVSLVEQIGDSLVLLWATAGIIHVWTLGPSGGWTRAPQDGGFATPKTRTATQIQDLSSARGTVVMVGSDRADFSDQLAALVLTYRKGEWVRASLPGVPAGATIRSVVFGNDRFLALGTSGEGVDSRSLLWSSSNGVDWLSVGGTKLDGFQRLQRVGSRTFAVGSIHGKLPDGTPHDSGAIAETKDDGASWQVSSAAGLGSEEFGVAVLGMCDGPLGLTAVGSRYNEALTSAAVWRNEKGADWILERDMNADVLPGTHLTVLESCAQLGRRLIATSYTADGSIVVGRTWPSRSWVLLPLPIFAITDGAVSLDILIEAPGGLLAAGSVRRNGRSVGTIWRSEDGLSWTLVGPGDGTLGPAAVSSSVSGLVQVGHQILAAGERDFDPATALVTI